jgi:hypothetical protein
MRFIRKIYNMNRKGHYPGVSFPQELANLLTEYVVIESTPDGCILLRPTLIIPK